MRSEIFSSADSCPKTCKKVLAAVLLSIGVQSLVGCTYVPAVEPTDLSVVRDKIATRAEVEAVLGEPVASRTENEGSVSVYSYNSGARGEIEELGKCTPECISPLAFLMFPVAWASTPIMYANKSVEQQGYLVVVYSVDDKIVRYKRRTGDTDIDLLLNSETVQLQLSEQSQAYINDVQTRAMSGDPDAMYEMASKGLWRTVSEKRRWYCLAAHAGHSQGRYKFGLYREDKRKFVQAYVWYALSLKTGSNQQAARKSQKLSKKMTPAQITEAEHLVAKWAPNPEECEVYAGQSETKASD